MRDAREGSMMQTLREKKETHAKAQDRYLHSYCWTRDRYPRLPSARSLL
jgi:hypothetical protein